MLLVDKDIRRLVEEKLLILDGFQSENLNSVSYDLTIDGILDEEGKKHSEYSVKPGEVVFVKTIEKLKIPNNIVGRVAEKNSRMRQGLKVDGPHYQPGHVTYAFLRVHNLSTKVIDLSRGNRIAQIMFEQLTEEPEVVYSAQVGASFNEEVEYVGLGNYKAEYEKQTKEHVDAVKDNIENISEKLYANVLTIMGVLVAIFSLLSINYQACMQMAIDLHYLVAMNLTLVLCIVVMMGLILVFVNKAKNKGFLITYTIILIALAVATFCFIL